MRWFIGVVIVAILAVVAWFWYPRLVPQESESPLMALPSSTWAVAQVTAQNQAIIQDSNQLLQDLLPEHIIAPMLTLTVENAAWIFLYDDAGQSAWGIITDHELVDQELRNALPNQRKSNNNFIYQQSESSSIVDLPKALTDALEVFEPNVLSVALKPRSTFAHLLNNTSKTLRESIMAQFNNDDWMGIELKEDQNVFRAYGIEQRLENNETTAVGSSSSNLMEYLPSKSGAAMIQAGDSLATALVYCPYQIQETANDRNLFVFVEHQGSTAPAFNAVQEYQGIPVGIEALPQVAMALEPSWKDEAFTARLSQHVWVYGASFESISDLIEDYLADDRLTLSPHFSPLEGFVSDAEFTLFMRPDLLIGSENYVIEEPIKSPINTLIYQTFEELPQQQFHAISALHHKEIKDVAPVAWTLRLDTTLAAGPWAFRNHYTGEAELLVQDHKHQLYLINHEGRTLWKKQLETPINDHPVTIDAFSNKKLQLVLTTAHKLYFIDRNGNDVKGFPVKLSKGSSAAPLCVKYSTKGDYRFITNNGKELVNVDPEGNNVKGWKKPGMNNELAAPLNYCNFNGKDYLIAQTKGDMVYVFDRAGKKRGKDFATDSNIVSLIFKKGTSFDSSTLLGYDHDGNIYTYSLSGKLKQENLLPLGDQVGVVFSNNQDHQIVTVKNDRVVSLDDKKDVGLDYLMPEAMEPTMSWMQANKTWIGLNALESSNYYILDLEGRLLDKMPLEGKGTPLLIDLDDNGSSECVIANGKGLLQAYKLAD